MDLIKANEVVQYQFYAIPRAFFVDEKYRKISLEAKMIYSFLLDRLSLSQKNNWFDENGAVFLIYTRKDISNMLCITEKTTIKAVKELKSISLLFEHRQGLGKPNLIYLGKINLDIQDKNFLHSQNCKNYTCGDERNTAEEVENLHTSNTDLNKTNLNYTDKSQSVESIELQEIKNKCELELFEETDNYGKTNNNTRNMIENAIDLMFYSENIKISNAILPQAMVRSRMHQLNGAILFYALDKLKTNMGNTIKVSNSTNYLISCIYNAINEYKSDAEMEYAIDIN